jgi:hypothetical protein
MMGMSCVPRMTVRQLIDLDLLGGMTKSIFPEVEAYLEVDHDHLNALQWIARNKSAERYESVMDWLFCETYRQYKGACMRFYADAEQPTLKDIITEPERKQCAWGLLQMIKRAYEAFKEERWISWGHLREQVLEEAA